MTRPALKGEVMTLAMLLMLFKTNKWLFLALIIAVGLAIWGLNIVISKLLNNNAGN
jgi:hypothetical protein